jgi:2-oxoglutarate dehydrogenase E2 component (dihydrolipoamide succinyltransferase)
MTMATEIRVPTLGESVSEATVGRWFKQPGDSIKADEPLVELETDKVTLEINAPAAGTLGDIAAKDGETVTPGAILGSIVEGAGASAPAAGAKPAAASKAAASPPPTKTSTAGDGSHGEARPAGAAGSAKPNGPATARGPVAPTLAPAPAQVRAPSAPDDASREERVRMTKLRQTIARRLKDAQNTAAMLTTFNDVDMGAVMSLRNQYKDVFEKKHGVKLGFMGFFTKACVQALKDIPAVNAEIDGQDLVYKNYYHVGIAVGTEKGLVVPVVRDADQLSIAGIEKKITEFGKRARDGQLKIEEMQGGTFTITNGGIYGSLMSTPILNAPQSGILGMHRIEERPMVRAGKIEPRPMMYLALSYDHRIVDGKEAVTFLVRVKEALEDPARLVLDL